MKPDSQRKNMIENDLKHQRISYRRVQQVPLYVLITLRCLKRRVMELSFITTSTVTVHPKFFALTECCGDVVKDSANNDESMVGI